MAIALDGQSSVSLTANGTTTINLTTTQSNDVIVVCVGTNAQGSSVTGGGLTFTQRSQVNNGNLWFTTFYAIAASSLSNVTLTVNWSNGNRLTSIWAFGVSGADTSTVWDTNGALPATSGTVDHTTYSTSNANDFVITGLTPINTATPAVPSGFTQIAGPNTSYFAGCGYEIVSATQSGTTVDWGIAGTAIIMVDAIMQASATPPVGMQAW